MPCGRLVEQHQLGLHRERGRDLERALAAVAAARPRGMRGVGRRGRPRRSSSQRPRVERCRATRSGCQKWNEVPSLRCSATRTFSSTVRCGNTAEIWNERTTPRRAIARRLLAGDVVAVEEDLPARRRQELGEQVEAGGLAGAVRADQRVDRAAAHLQVHVVDRDEALELLGELARLEDEVAAGRGASCAHVRPPRRRSAPPAERRSRRATSSAASRWRAPRSLPSCALLMQTATPATGLAGGVEHRRAERVDAFAHRLRRRCCSRASRVSASSLSSASMSRGPLLREARRRAGRRSGARTSSAGSWASIALPLPERYAGRRMPTLNARPSGRALLRTRDVERLVAATAPTARPSLRARAAVGPERVEFLGDVGAGDEGLGQAHDAAGRSGTSRRRWRRR